MRTFLLLSLIIILGACTNNKTKSDAFGNFETDEVIVSSENSGKIVLTAFIEGEKVNQGAVMAITDTVNLVLQRSQLIAQKESVLAQKAGLYAQIAVSDQQITNIQKDQVRIKKMLVDGAATPKQMDDIDGQIALAGKQKQAFAAQISAIEKSGEAVVAQIAVLNDRITTSVIKSPISGIILEKYAETGELATPGKSLYKMANMDNLILRVYVSGPQLTQIKTGSQVKVMIDGNEGIKEITGTVEWISSEAEFTPKIIQTREERVKLVYAAKVRVPNDGSLKLGMPGEIKF
ncbi:MAG: HlyD family efflux transporter periplasmic adaptor subunit [Bacteroidia bacterium]|nr:HlyD family efflux transporter periplasmic adaptor subunit [Bacteroidia bacterium]